MVKGGGAGLYSDIGKRARDLLYKDHNSDHKFTLTTYSPSGIAITSSGTKKGELLLGDVSFQSKRNNFTTDLIVSTDSTVLITATVDEAAPSWNEKGDVMNASYYHIVNPLLNTSVGAQVSHRFSNKDNTITVGTQHSLDPLTLVKSRVNSAGIVSALIQHEWRPKSLLTISGEVDTKSI
ncbi:unnamed protein product [Cochlearia groenlandica]